MTIRINLLPHREEKRKRRLGQYIAMAVVTLVTSLAAAGAVWYVFDTQIEGQKTRNKFMTDQISRLDKDIDEIKRIREETADLLQKKQVVESLQANRSEPVFLLDQLLRQLPDGLYLKTIKQTDRKVLVTGYAQSNARVSTFMRNIAGSPYLENPELVEIKAVEVNKVRANEFSLNLSVKRAKVDDGKSKAPAKPAEKKA